jgi:hypothetical protein
MAEQGAQFYFRTKLQNITYWTMHQCLLKNFTPFYVFKDQTQHPLLNQIHHVIHNLAVDKKSHSSGCQDIVVFKAMRADKAATNLQMPSDLKMNTCDLKSKIKKERLATWQNQWEQTTSQMLNIKRTTKRWKAFKVFNRRA